MDCLEKLWMFAPWSLIWFHRVIGITFNGFLFDKHFVITHNKILKYYGYISLSCYIVANLYYIAYYCYNWKFTRDSLLGNNTPTYLVIIHATIMILFKINHTILLYTINVNCDIIILKCVKELLNCIKIKIIFIFWLAMVATFIGVCIRVAIELNVNSVILDTINDIHTLTTAWTFSCLFWIIILSHGQRLKTVHHNLTRDHKGKSNILYNILYHINSIKAIDNTDRKSVV